MKTKLFALCALFVCLFTLGSFTQVEARHHRKTSVSSFSLNLGLGLGCLDLGPSYCHSRPVVVREYYPVPAPQPYYVAYPQPYPQPYYQEVYVRPAPVPAYYYFR